MPDKPQLHVSDLNQMAVCGIQFQRRKGYRFGVWHEEEVIPPGMALLTGISVHKSVERNLQNKIDTGELLPLEQVKDITRDQLLLVANGGISLRPEESLDPNKAIGSAIDQAVDLATLHHDELAPIIQPVDLEKKFVIELKGYPYDLAGQIDLVAVKNEIIDLKTAAPARVTKTALTIQTDMYCLSEKVADKKANGGDGKMPDKVSLHYLVKNKTPKVVVRESVPDETRLPALFRRIEQAIKLIESVKSGKGYFMPAQPDTWQCSRDWCGYYDTCPFAGR